MVSRHQTQGWGTPRVNINIGGRIRLARERRQLEFCGFMLRGTLKVQTGFDEYVLRQGDAMAFDSSQPHLLVNEEAEPAVGIWFVLRQPWAPSPLPSRVAKNSVVTVPRRRLRDHRHRWADRRLWLSSLC